MKFKEFIEMDEAAKMGPPGKRPTNSGGPIHLGSGGNAASSFTKNDYGIVSQVMKKLGLQKRSAREQYMRKKLGYDN